MRSLLALEPLGPRQRIAIIIRDEVSSVSSPEINARQKTLGVASVDQRAMKPSNVVANEDLTANGVQRLQRFLLLLSHLIQGNILALSTIRARLILRHYFYQARAGPTARAFSLGFLGYGRVEAPGEAKATCYGYLLI